jgi:23S rRNA (pseudouridine1915-N3)-methyltransferase
MKITVLCAGKVKEAFYRDALAEYAKRLFPYCSLEIIEVADERNLPGQEEQAIAKEGARMLAKMPEHAYIAALCIDGRQRSSEEMAAWLSERMNHGDSHIVFVIGGSLGLSPEIVSRADEKVSFSRLTFPHQLMRVILLEQIYRSFKIMKGEPYHK